MRVGVVVRYVNASFRDPASCFIMDEMLELVRLGVDVHALRLAPGSPRIVWGFTLHSTTPLDVIGGLARSVVWWRSTGPLPLVESIYAHEIVRRVERCGIDILHAHFAYPAGYAASLAKRVSGKPLVVTVHGYDVLVNKRRSYGVRLKKGFEHVVRSALLAADRVVVNSKCLYNAVNGIAPLGEKTVLIPQGVDLSIFKPRRAGWLRRKLGVRDDEVAIFTLKEHNRICGVEYLIVAFKHLIDRGVRGARLLIGGTGPLTRLYVELAYRLGLRELVKFTGRIPRIRVPWYMSAIDIYVQPSLLEGFGLALTEAMACAKPVVASRVGGLLDQVVDGFNGILVEPGNSESIADALQYLLENPSERVRMGFNARRVVEERFSLRERAVRILKLYRELA